MFNNTDGNLAALNKYLKEQDDADIAWDHINSFVTPILQELEGETDEDTIESLTVDIMSYADHLEGYDFSDDLNNAIKEALNA